VPRITTIFKALADDTRLRILNLLRQRETCVCEIVDVLGLCQSKVSRHLATLKHAGLVSCRREGPWVYYSLTSPDSDLSARIMDWLWVAKDQIRSGVSDLETLRALDRCDSNTRPDSRESHYLPEETRLEASATVCGAAAMIPTISASGCAAKSVP
jgi:ArsR family transcriptional regulator